MSAKPYYTCNNKIFDNKFKAAIESSLSNRPIHFNLFDAEFSKADWSKDPELSWDQLLDIRAHQIAAKNKPIVLLYSGGWDSNTVLNVFQRNNIHIDTLILHIKQDPAEAILYDNVLKYFKDNPDQFKDSNIIIENCDVDMLNAFYNSEDWCWETGARLNFTIGLTEAINFDQNHHINRAITDDHILISGYEKPRLLIKDSVIYSYQEDTTFLATFTDPRHEYFFISPELPELHIKQSYMLAKYIKFLADTNNVPLTKFNNAHDGTVLSWTDYSLATGRTFDLGQSHIQKFRNRYSFLEIDNDNWTKIKHTGRFKGMLAKGIVENDPFARNYINGLLNLRNDSRLSSIFTQPNNYFSIMDIRSIRHKLGNL